MRKEFDDLLVKTFPNLYKDRYASSQETCMCWGFPGDGWFLIIWNLSEKLEKLILDTPEDERDGMQATQVKEKFGKLRFYIDTYSEEVQQHIKLAEKLSAITCEDCGAPGQMRKGGWIRVLCDGCYQVGKNG
jgi:hypothetical protein